MEETLNEKKLKDLKVHAYDLQAKIAYYQQAFTSVNNQIINLMQEMKAPKEVKESKEIESKEIKESENLKPTIN